MTPPAYDTPPGQHSPPLDDSLKRELDRALEDLEEAQRTYKLHHLYADIYANGHHWLDPATGEPEGGPYLWQVDFHTAGASHRFRGIIAANQVGKSRSAAAEVAMHLTGDYPEWWEGHRFDHPIEAMACGETNQDLRDICQEQLLGKMVEGEPDGTGWIPRPMIGEHKKRQCGVSDVIDYVLIRHRSGAGGWSKLFFKSYEQGVSKFQGFQRDLIWADEEPPSDQDRFLSEILTRLMKRKGRLIFTRTPLLGETPIVRFFMRGKREESIWHINVGWEDAPHFTPAQIEQELATTPDHLRLAKSKGIPQLGSGPIYPIGDEAIKVNAFDIPPHWRRLCAMDFGVGQSSSAHPTAAVWIAHDPESDEVVLYDCYRKRDTAIVHAQAIKARPGGEDIPVAWPHDGLKQEAGSGQALCDIYRKLGVKMLPKSARYDDDHGGGQSPEPAIEIIIDRMRTGRFKVFAHLLEWFEEKRMYHRENGRIVKEEDDLMAATNYAIMMLRYARIVGKARGDRLRRLTREQEQKGGYRPLGRFSSAGV